MLTFVSDEQYNNAQHLVVEKGGSQEAIFQVAGHPSADVIAVHGVGRYVFPMTDQGYLRPMRADNFATYLKTRFPGWDNVTYPGRNLPSIKLSICFGALPGPSSVAQTLATALGRNTYAGRGFVFPSDLSRSWVTFTP
jgi:hypothetical protein